MSKLVKTAVLLTLVGSMISAPQPVFADEVEAHLTGGVTKVEMPGGIAAQAQKLMDVAYQNNETGQYIDHLIDRYQKLPHKAKVVASEFAYAIVPYRGFGPSKDGANILLEKVKKVKTLGAAEYFKQRIQDDLHSRISASLLKMSEGLDNLDSLEGKQLVAGAYNELIPLVGKEKAGETVEAMVAWSKDIAVPQSVYTQKAWDIGTLNQKIRRTTGASVSTDDVFTTVVKKLNKYNRTKLMCAISTAVESTSAMCAIMAPGFLAPIGAELVNATFITSTGGNEETKMLNELYLAKRMESRWKRLNEESQMALTAYQMALSHKSPTLLACSENLIRNLCGTKRAQEMLGQTIVPPTEAEEARLAKAAEASQGPDNVADFVAKKLADPKTPGAQNPDLAAGEIDDVRERAIAEDDGKAHLFRRMTHKIRKDITGNPASKNASDPLSNAGEGGGSKADETASTTSIRPM